MKNESTTYQKPSDYTIRKTIRRMQILEFLWYLTFIPIILVVGNMTNPQYTNFLRDVLISMSIPAVIYFFVLDFKCPVCNTKFSYIKPEQRPVHSSCYAEQPVPNICAHCGTNIKQYKFFHKIQTK